MHACIHTYIHTYTHTHTSSQAPAGASAAERKTPLLVRYSNVGTNMPELNGSTRETNVKKRNTDTENNDI